MVLDLHSQWSAPQAKRPERSIRIFAFSFHCRSATQKPREIFQRSRNCTGQSIQEPQGSVGIGRHKVNRSLKIIYFSEVSIGFHKRRGLFWEQMPRRILFACTGKQASAFLRFKDPECVSWGRRAGVFARRLDALEVERKPEKTVGTFVSRLLQKGGQLWKVPSISSERRVLASHSN